MIFLDKAILYLTQNIEKPREIIEEVVNWTVIFSLFLQDCSLPQILILHERFILIIKIVARLLRNTYG